MYIIYRSKKQDQICFFPNTLQTIFFQASVLKNLSLEKEKACTYNLILTSGYFPLLLYCLLNLHLISQKKVKKFYYKVYQSFKDTFDDFESVELTRFIPDSMTYNWMTNKGSFTATETKSHQNHWKGFYDIQKTGSDNKPSTELRITHIRQEKKASRKTLSNWDLGWRRI